jgi:hypothetical protein
MHYVFTVASNSMSVASIARAILLDVSGSQFRQQQDSNANPLIEFYPIIS